MIKLINCIRRKAKWTREEFQDHWYEFHGPFAPAEPSIRSYTQYHTLADEIAPDVLPYGQDSTLSPFEGFAVVTYDDLDALQQAFGESPVMKAGILDDQYFVDMDRSVACLTHENVLFEPRTNYPTMDTSILEPPSYVLVQCLRKRADVSSEAFHDSWAEYGELLLETSEENEDLGLMGYIQNHTLREGGFVEEISGDDPFDGIGMAYFGSVLYFKEFAARSFGAEPVARKLGGLIDPARSIWMLTERKRLQDPIR